MAGKLVIKFVLVAFAACLVGGCTQYWYSKNKTFSQCREDCMECRVESNAYIETYEKSGKFLTKYEEKCMRQKGYHLVSEDWLPLKSKKREPDPLYKEKYGIAGSLIEEPVVDIQTEEILQ